jgi:hypothetical protein
VIDVSVLVGASPRLQPADEYGISAAQRELTAHRISTALLATRTGAAYRAEVGNDLDGSCRAMALATIAAEHPRWNLIVAHRHNPCNPGGLPPVSARDIASSTAAEQRMPRRCRTASASCS